MVSASKVESNGRFLDCSSDYPAIDVTPLSTPPRPKWRDQFPAFTHNLSWQDSDKCNHSMTLRSDSLSDLMSDLRMLKNMIKAAKQQASERAPQQASQPQADAASETEQPNTQRCQIHAVDMIRRWSKRTQGHYFGHKLSNGDFCYGRALKA